MNKASIFSILASRIRSRLWPIFLGAGVSAGCFLYIEKYVDLDLLRKSIFALEFDSILIVSILIFLSIQMRCIRYGVVAKIENQVIGSKISWLAYLFNQILPAKLGEVVRIHLVFKEKKCSLAYCATKSVVDRAFDLLILFVLLLLVFLFRSDILVGYTFFQYLVFLVVVFMAMYFLYLVFNMYGLTRIKLPSIVRDQIKGVGVALRDMTAKEYFVAGAISVAVLLLDVFLAYNIFIALKISVSWLAPLIITLFLYFSAALPSAPAQIGVHQAAAVLAMKVFGFEESMAVTYSVLQQIITFMMIAGVSFVLWVAYPVIANVKAGGHDD